MYKCINKLAPDYLADKFVQRSHIHNRNTRFRNQLGPFQTSHFSCAEYNANEVEQ